MQWCSEALAGEVGPPPRGIDRDVLPGWADTWLVSAREDFHVLRLHALEAAAGKLLIGGRLGEAYRIAAMASALDPLRESAVRLLIEIHLRESNAVEAVRRYVRFADMLRAEIGIDPNPNTTALVANFVDTGDVSSRRHRALRQS